MRVRDNPYVAWPSHLGKVPQGNYPRHKHKKVLAPMRSCLFMSLVKLESDLLLVLIWWQSGCPDHRQAWGESSDEICNLVFYERDLKGMLAQRL